MTIDREEKELLKAIVGGDRSAFTALYSQLADQLYNYIYTFTRSEDISKELVQDVFIQLWVRRDLLEGVTDLRPYVFRTTKNRLLNYLKSRKSYATLLKKIELEQSVFSVRQEEKLDYNHLEKVAHEAISQLPPKRKLIFQLSTQENLRLDEIAAHLNISKSVVKKQLYAAISSVKSYLQTHAKLNSLLFIISLASVLFFKEK